MVKIFNPDGSEAEKSGNGVRIFAKYLKDAGYIKDKSFILKTLGGDVNVKYLNESAKYFKNRINTQIVKVLDRNNIQIEIYERGAGYTLASGSSSCAAAGASFKLGLVNNNIIVHMPGGNLEIEIDNDYNVNMTGSVSSVCYVKLKDEFIGELHEI